MPSNTRILEILQQPWAVQPQVLESWCGLVEAKAKGEDLGIQTRAAFGDDEQEFKLDIIDGIAVIPIQGSLVKRHFMFRCGSSFQEIQEKVQAALEHPAARAVLLVVDSPGGTVDGTAECAHFLARAAEQKPLYAYADGLMASAAYWLGCCACEIAAPSTAAVGSIGVVTVHYDRSQADEKYGLKRTFITSGAYKAAGNDASPLSDGDHTYIQSRSDHIYNIFLEHVAKGRGVSVKEAQAMADGKVFIGSQALEAGLVDRIVSGIDEFISLIKEEIVMDLKTLKAEHPALYEQVVSEAKANMVPQAEVDQATQAERERILGLADASFESSQAKTLAALVKSGATPEQAQAFKQAFGASGPEQPPNQDEEDEAKAEILKGIKAAGQAPLKPGASQEVPKDFDAKVQAYMSDNRVSRAEAIKAVAKSDPDAHEAWLNKKQGKKG